MKKLFFILVPLLIAFGLFVYINPEQMFTNLVLRVSGYVIAPQYESPTTILARVKNDKLYYDRLYRLKDYNAYNELGDRKILTFPFIHIYNRDKQMLTAASGAECKWVLMEFIKNPDSLNLVVTDTLMYDFVEKRLVPVDLIAPPDSFEFYIHAGWVNYLPKFTSGLFEQTNAIKGALDNRVCISYINMDFQEEWKPLMDSLEAAGK